MNESEVPSAIRAALIDSGSNGRNDGILRGNDLGLIDAPFYKTVCLSSLPELNSNFKPMQINADIIAKPAASKKA